jgi:hypothetical protein
MANYVQWRYYQERKMKPPALGIGAVHYRAALQNPQSALADFASRFLSYENWGAKKFHNFVKEMGELLNRVGVPSEWCSDECRQRTIQ